MTVNEMKYMELGFLDVAYRRRGTGAPLLLLHGGEGDHHNFDGIFDLLSPWFDTIAYDQRDCGASIDHRERDYSVKDLAADAAQLMVSLGFGKMHVMGSSAGGLVAQALALYFPERVDRLILNVTVPVNEGVAQCNPGVLARIAQLQANDDFRGIAEVFSTPAYVAQHPDLIATVRSLRSGVTLPPEKHARRTKAIRTPIPDADLQAITHKCLVLAGECDQIATLDAAKRLASRLPNSDLKVIPAGGHTAMLENPDLYSVIIRGFLREATRF